ncbi:MAG: Smr/MutS family protein [Chitinophagales bacterium]|nr:Smr/MutS family protein [Chitinophagales bacterium]MCO5280301.1 Smr/MutS family protein [Chitinophagales bacterium]OJV26449.1 MAG: hypothetical protein BGO32_12695 [Bacteroidetes bacterium 37-13]HRN93688.1 Smr/MutS family protein [Chitinophagales bacterium]HRP39468.1 Smr/MutS family protein [Chitinophagales bacterium]
MSKKKKKTPSQGSINTNVLKMFMMGAANPAASNKTFHNTADVVDLHLSQSDVKGYKIDATGALMLQLEQVERSIDAAVAARKMELRVVHGFGKGTLKEEIHKMLRKHPLVKSFENDYLPSYGWGSTLIKFY